MKSETGRLFNSCSGETFAQSKVNKQQLNIATERKRQILLSPVREGPFPSSSVLLSKKFIVNKSLGLWRKKHPVCVSAKYVFLSHSSLGLLIVAQFYLPSGSFQKQLAALDS